VDLLGGVEGERSSNRGALAWSADDVKFPVKLVDALANSRNSDAQWHTLGGFRNILEDSYTIVLNFDGDGIRAALNANGRRAGLGVAVNVRERFLDDAKDGEFEFLFEAAKIVSDVNLNRGTTTLGEEFRVGTESDKESGFVEQRRMQEGRNEAHFADRGVDQASRGSKQPLNSTVPWNGAADLRQRHFQRGQRLRRGFVELTAHAALLVAANGEQLMGEPTHTGLRARLRSNIAGYSDDANNFSVGIGNRRAEAIQNPDGAVGQGVRLRKFKREAGANRGLEFPPEFSGVLTVQGSPEPFRGEWRLRRAQSEQLAKVIGEPDSAIGQSEFPGSYFGVLFSMFQHEFGFAQTFFDLVVRGNVLHFKDEVRKVGGAPLASSAV
jgi:hypothetical protein